MVEVNKVETKINYPINSSSEPATPEQQAAFTNSAFTAYEEANGVINSGNCVGKSLDFGGIELNCNGGSVIASGSGVEVFKTTGKGKLDHYYQKFDPSFGVVAGQSEIPIEKKD